MGVLFGLVFDDALMFVLLWEGELRDWTWNFCMVEGYTTAKEVQQTICEYLLLPGTLFIFISKIGKEENEKR